MNSYPIVFGRILKGKNLEDVTEFDFLKSGLTLKGKNLEGSNTTRSPASPRSAPV